jgi:3',5'-cyclic AMP phosphodiesterase CpdA
LRKTTPVNGILIAVFIVLWSCTAASASRAAAGEDSFRFVVFGDNRTAGPDSPIPESFPRIVEEVSLFHPALVFHTGDLVSGGRTKDETERQYRDSMDIIRRLNAPFHIAPGNHEFDGAGGRESFRKFISPKTYYSFDYGNSHFILLNSDMEESRGWIRGEQMAWLKKDLEKSRGKSHVFVFLHRPPFAPLDPDFDPSRHRHMDFASRDNRDELASLFSKYHVNTVFCGHEHLYSTEVRQGVRYTTTAGLGAPMYAPPEKGGFLHYVLVTVNGSEVASRPYEPWHIHSEYHDNDGSAENPWVMILNTNCEPVTLDGIVLKAVPGDYRVEMAPMPESFKSKRFFRNASAEVLEKKVSNEGLFVALRIRALVPQGIPIKIRLVKING